MLDAKGLEAGAREEARWDGRDFDALGSADRSRYLGRFADGVTAYLEAVGGEPVQAPAVRVKGLADKLKLAEYVMTKDSFCEAERLEEGLSVVRRIRSALVATPPAAMTCDEQFALATKLAGDLGYDLVPEPPHPDTPVDNFSGQTIPPAERVVEALPNWNGWRSIDTAPEDWRVILATAGGWVGEAIMLRDEDTGEQVWTWVDTGKPSLHSCYGWMPLPAPLVAPVLSDLRPDGFDGPTGAE